MKRILAIGLVMMLFLCSGCQTTSENPSISGKVSILYGDQEIISEEITTNKNTAEDVLLEVCKNNKIPYRLDNHMFDGFGGYDSTDTDGWILYVDGAMADKGAYQMTIADGFSVSFVYVNYSDAFFAE